MGSPQQEHKTCRHGHVQAPDCETPHGIYCDGSLHITNAARCGVVSCLGMPCAAAGMEVVSVEIAQQMRAEGQFLVHQEVLGHIYGITSSAVRKLQAMGKLPVLDLDRVQDVEQLRASGFQVCAGRDVGCNIPPGDEGNAGCVICALPVCALAPGHDATSAKTRVLAALATGAHPQLAHCIHLMLASTYRCLSMLGVSPECGKAWMLVANICC